eukprot:5253565-Prymnesium_polylepis.1
MLNGVVCIIDLTQVAGWMTQLDCIDRREVLSDARVCRCLDAPSSGRTPFDYDDGRSEPARPL